MSTKAEEEKAIKKAVIEVVKNMSRVLSKTPFQLKTFNTRDPLVSELTPREPILITFNGQNKFGILHTDGSSIIKFANENELNNYILSSQIGVSSGVASLDASGKIPVSQLPDSAVGGVSFKGLWNANTNTPSLPTGSEKNGDFYKVSVPGNFDGTDYSVGDWIIYTGAAYEKLDQSEEVSSVNGQTGSVVLVKSDVGLGNVDNTADIDKVVSVPQQSALNLKANLESPALTGVPTTPTAAAEDNSTQIANTETVNNLIGFHLNQEVF